MNVPGRNAGQLRALHVLALLISLTAACESITGGNDDFDHVFRGTWSGGQSDRSSLNGQIGFNITSGAIAGDVSPISGSRRALTGTVSATGAVTMRLESDTNGCAVTLSGQLTPASSTELTATGAAGGYVLIESPTCRTNTGSWTVTRR